MGAAEHELGAGAAFTLELDAAPGTPLSRVRDLERAIEDYAESHDLEMSGTQLRFLVQALGRRAQGLAATSGDQALKCPS